MQLLFEANKDPPDQLPQIIWGDKNSILAIHHKLATLTIKLNDAHKKYEAKDIKTFPPSSEELSAEDLEIAISFAKEKVFNTIMQPKKGEKNEPPLSIRPAK